MEENAPEFDSEPIAEFGENTFKTYLFAPPIVLCLVFVARAFFPFRFFFNYFCLLTHELGHATHAWASSRFAIPLPYGETRWFETQSTTLYVLAALLCLALSIFSVRERRWGGPVVSVAWLVLQTWVTYFISPERSLMGMVYGGLNGQFILPVIGVLLFYARFPPILRWDFWRFPVLFLSLYVFVDAFTFWNAIETGQAALPTGSLLQGQDDPNGDINRLLNDYAWTSAGLTRTLVSTGEWGRRLMVGAYLVFVAKALFEKTPQKKAPTLLG